MKRADKGCVWFVDAIRATYMVVYEQGFNLNFHGFEKIASIDSVSFAVKISRCNFARGQVFFKLPVLGLMKNQVNFLKNTEKLKAIICPLNLAIVIGGVWG